MAKKKTTEEAVSDFASVHGNRYDYSRVEYVNSATKVEIICPEHGSFFQTKNNHMNGLGCYHCGLEKNSERRSKDQDVLFLKNAKKVHGERYDYSKVEYKSSKEKVIIICPEHGEFEQSPNFHLRGCGCPECASNRRSQKMISRSKENLIERVRGVHGDKYEYDIDSYKNSDEKFSIFCPEHGKFEQTMSNHLAGQNCPKCSHLVSKPEKELVDFLYSLGIDDIILNDRSLISPKEVDIYIPSISVAIEFNGLKFHSEAYNKDRLYHLSKTEDCESKGVRLIHIYEDEWIENRPRVESLLTSIISPGYLEKRSARKLNVFGVSNAESKKFLLDNHIQGNKGSTVKYGLYDGDTMVAYIGLSSLKDGWHIDRFASVGSVRGGFSKLLKHFKRNNDWNRIISFADRRYSQGKVYKSTGFELDSITAPGYDYEKNRKRFNRQLFMKHKLEDKLDFFDYSLTERENMAINGYYRIWNCGMLKFVMTND